MATATTRVPTYLKVSALDGSQAQVYRIRNSSRFEGKCKPFRQSGKTV